tara:strand:+ start:703 stop:1872 length:1170 start_codon:yes stop_codon:yes gene_type:complete
MTTILFFIEGMNFGGQQTFSYNVLKNLDKEKYNIIVTYVFDGDLKGKFEEIASELIQIGSPYDPFNAFADKGKMLKMAIELRSIVKRKKADVLISNGFISYFTSCFATAFLSTKHIRFIGGDLSKNEGFHFNNNKFHLLPLHRFTDVFIGYNYILNLIRDKGVDSKKLNNLFFRGGVDFNHFGIEINENEIRELRKKNDIPDSNIAIGWLGRIEKNMEIRFTLDLIISLKKKGFDKFNFLIIGDGKWKPELIEIAKNNQVFENLRFLGYIKQENLPVVLKAIDIMPLLDVDPHGGSILREAMAAGTCAMTVDGKSGEQRNIIEHMKTGVLVDKDNFVDKAADLIIELSKEPSRIEEMAKAGQNFVKENLDFKVLSNGLESVVDSLTKGR